MRKNSQPARRIYRAPAELDRLPGLLDLHHDRRQHCHYYRRQRHHHGCLSPPPRQAAQLGAAPAAPPVAPEGDAEAAIPRPLEDDRHHRSRSSHAQCARGRLACAPLCVRAHRWSSTYNVYIPPSDPTDGYLPYGCKRGGAHNDEVQEAPEQAPRVREAHQEPRHLGPPRGWPSESPAPR